MKKYCPLLLIVLLACGRPAVTNDPRIREAESIVWDAPDSALAILAEIDTLQLDARQQADYSLIYIQARDKAGYDIPWQEKVFKLKNYYANSNNVGKAALATYYAGRVYQMRGDNTSAAQEYLDALRYEEKIEDRQLKGLIHINLGMLHYEQSHFDEAVYELRKSVHYFAPNTSYASLSLKKIGNIYAVLQQADSARIYYEQALKSTRQLDNPVILSEILQDMGVLVEELGDYIEAKKYYHESVSLIGEQDRAVPYLNLGWVYFQANQFDSAGFYAGQSYHLLRDEGYLYALVSAYELLHRVEKAKENYQDALAWHEQYTDSLFVAQAKKNDLAIMELKKQYQTESLMDKIRRRNLAIALTVVAALLVVAVVCIVMYRKSVKKDKEIEELNRLMTTLEEMAASVHNNEKTETPDQVGGKKEIPTRVGDEAETPVHTDRVKTEKSNYRSIALQHFNALKKMALLEAGLDGEEKKKNNALKKFNQAVYGNDEFDWDKMFMAFNALEDGFLNKTLKFFRGYPELDETDFRVWCLSYAKLSQDEIALFLKLTFRNVQTRFTKIRETFGVEKRGNIDRFLKDKIVKNPSSDSATTEK